MEDTKIQWADHTWNPWIGCTRVHTGCVNCYAEAQAGRHGVEWGPSGTRRKTSDAYWRKPIVWNRKALERQGKRIQAPQLENPRVFPSLCDPFEDWDGPIIDAQGRVLYRASTNGGAPKPGEFHASDALGPCWRVTMNDLRQKMFKVIDETPNLTWILLTKRPQNIQGMWPSAACATARENVWLVYSASDQETYDNGVRDLLEYRDYSPVLGLSLEPLVGPIDLGLGDTSTLHLDWVIVGGESGRNSRPCHIDWIRSIRDQCWAAGVPLFIKQLGRHVHKDTSGGQRQSWFPNDPKGGDVEEWPHDLLVREFPT